MDFRTVVRRAAGAVLALLALAAAGPASAAWYKAETDRFVVYGEAREARVLEYAQKLQAFDAMLRLYHPSTKERVPDTKVQVVLLNSYSDLRRVMPELTRQVGGAYRPNNEGVFAFAITRGDMDWQDDVIFHEYAHHFMRENFPAAYPAWFVEGFAEYFMTAKITPTGVRVGEFNDSRVWSVVKGDWLPLEDLFTKTTWQTDPKKRHAYYAQAWLLTHYMRATPERANQLNRAVAAIARGEAPIRAFERETGMTMAELTQALRGYKKIPVSNLTGEFGKGAQVAVTRLPDSTDDLLLDNIRLYFSVPGRTDAEFLAGVRRKAARWPDEPTAQMTLARAEFVMGDVAAGEAIVGRLLAERPTDKEVVLLAGMGQFLAGLRSEAERQKRFRAARQYFAKVYAMDKKDFRALYFYAESRSIEPGYPTDNDVNAWVEAHALAPSVFQTTMKAGVALLQKGRKDEAAKLLAAVVNDPHGGAAAAQARALLAGKSMAEALTAAEAEAAKESEADGGAD